MTDRNGRRTTFSLERLERRWLPASPALVAVPAQFPAAAAVQVDAVYDNTDDPAGAGRLSPDDQFFSGSAAVVGPDALLTAAHLLYDLDSGRFATWVFAHPARQGDSGRSVGEVQGRSLVVPQQYAGGDRRYDLGVVRLDRNVGPFTGELGYGSLPDAAFTTAPPAVRVFHYPARYGYDGRTLVESASAEAITAVDDLTIYTELSELWTAGGSSGGPLLADGYSRGGRSFDDVIVGVVSRGPDVPVGGAGEDAYTRVSAGLADFVGAALAGPSSAVDRPAVVGADRWFDQDNARLSAALVRPGQPLTASVPLYNAGTAAARDVTVRFRLSTDDRYDGSDLYLGETTLASLEPFGTSRAELALDFPGNDRVPAGNYFVVWSADPDGTSDCSTTALDDYREGQPSHEGALPDFIRVAEVDGAATDAAPPPADRAAGEPADAAAALGVTRPGRTGTNQSAPVSPPGRPAAPADVNADAPAYAVAEGGGGRARVNVYDGAGLLRFGVTPGSGEGVRVAVADVTGDGVADLVTGAGPGGTPTVNVYDGTGGGLSRTFDAFESSFAGGVFVALGDFDGDGSADIVVSPDEGGGPRVRVFSGATGAVLADFFGIDDPTFRGGARVAAGDMNGDGAPDLLVAAGFGGGPRVAGFDGRSLLAGAPQKLFGDFFLFEPALRNGVFVSAADINGDGSAELIAGAGPGGGPRVVVLSGRDLMAGSRALLADFFAGDTGNRGGVRVLGRDLDGDGLAELVTAAGTDAPAAVTVYNGVSLRPDAGPAVLRGDTPFGGEFDGGVFVG